MRTETPEYVKVADLLEFCRIAAENCENLRQKSIAGLDKPNASMSLFTDLCQAEEYFAKEYCRWTYDIPNMIKT